jgi:hypothetical protein
VRACCSAQANHNSEGAPDIGADTHCCGGVMDLGKVSPHGFGLMEADEMRVDTRARGARPKG